MKKTKLPLFLAFVIAHLQAPPAQAQEEKQKNLLPIPDKLVVLTFDDGNVSDLTTTAPILKKHGFGATFYITSGWIGGAGRLTWEQVKELDAQGFEIGSHSASHPNMLHISEEEVREQIASFDRACEEHGIRKAKTFAYPGEHHDRRIVKALATAGYSAARRGVTPEYPLFDRGGSGLAYNPREEDPFLIPGAYVRGNLSPSDREFNEALGKARDGSVCVLIYHGVPDVHPHCSTSIELFTKDMQYLKDEGCTVIALRDLAKYVDFSKGPKDIYAPIMARLGVTASALKCDTSGDKPRFSWNIKPRAHRHNPPTRSSSPAMKRSSRPTRAISGTAAKSYRINQRELLTPVNLWLPERNPIGKCGVGTIRTMQKSSVSAIGSPRNCSPRCARCAPAPSAIQLVSNYEDTKTELK